MAALNSVSVLARRSYDFVDRTPFARSPLQAEKKEIKIYNSLTYTGFL